MLSKPFVLLVSYWFSRYNAKEHPIAFHKADDLGKAPKKLAASGPAPDLEEAYEVGLSCTPPLLA